MELKIFSPQEALYRRNTLIYFYVFGVIGSEMAFDHIDNGWLLDKEIAVPPILSPFLTVSLTKQGGQRCKQWVKESGHDINNLPDLVDPYLLESNVGRGKFLMSETRLRQEFKDKRSQYLLKMYDFDAAL